MNKKWVMANWKMHGSTQMVKEYMQGLAPLKIDPKLELGIFPPYVYLDLFSQGLSSGNYHLGAQNVASETAGAYTGEVSASMLKDIGCQYVLVGHSERRQLFAEDPEVVAKKFHIVLAHDMIPVFCIGEDFSAYQAKRTKEVLCDQLKSLLKNTDFSFEKCIIAYEPIWAIGSGLIPSAEELNIIFAELHDIIKKNQAHSFDVPMLYGGSVSEKNIEMFAKLELCQGVLVGGASLKIKSLTDIIECITCY